MNDIKLQRKHYIIGGIILLMLFTNPSSKTLRDQVDNSSGRIVRRFNGLIFSVYSKNNSGKNETYLGLLGNFINLTRY